MLIVSRRFFYIYSECIFGPSLISEFCCHLSFLISYMKPALMKPEEAALPAL